MVVADKKQLNKHVLKSKCIKGVSFDAENTLMGPGSENKNKTINSQSVNLDKEKMA